MSTLAFSPTVPSPAQLLTHEQLTVIVACCSSLVLFLVIIAMLSVIYHKDPQCCKVPSYQVSRRDMHGPSQYHSSWQTLVGSACLDRPEDSFVQDGQLFFVGLPSSYSLAPLEPAMPRLPSYESVRKKDRQRQIHMMIADRFGLNGPAITEPPPTYEESVRHSVDIPYDFLLPSPDGPMPTDSAAAAVMGRSHVAPGESVPPQCGADEGTDGVRLPV